MSVFAFDADVCGEKLQVTVDHTRTGFDVVSPAGPKRARTHAESVRIAAREVGIFLQRAERPGVPWGLHVSVGPVAAVYGTWPPLMAPTNDTRPAPSEVVRIRRLWRDTDGPLAALENACKVVAAYAGYARAA